MPKDVAHEYPDDLDPEALGERIRTARLEADGRVTQLAMAVAVGVSLSAYASWEQGRHRPHRRELARLERLTGKSHDYFLGLDDA